MTLDEAWIAYDTALTVAAEQKALADLLRVARKCEADGTISDDSFQNVLVVVQAYLDGED